MDSLTYFWAFVASSLLCVAISCSIYTFLTAGEPTMRLPPGPKPVPFLGNVHHLPSTCQHRTLAEWGTRYGDVVFARLFRTPTLVINSLQAAQDLLDKRSAKYSDRPRFVLLAELMGWDCVLTHMAYGDRFRKHRKWISNAFEDKKALASYRPLQQRETYVLVNGLLKTPHLFRAHIRRYSAAMIMEITYGHIVTSLDDKYIHLAERAATETVKCGGAGSMLVDFFPILQHVPSWFPGATFKKEALKVKLLVRSMLDTPFEMVKGNVNSGTAVPSFTATLLETLSEGIPSKEDEEDVKGAAGVLYGAATDTTTAVLATFVLAMLLHPDVYKKAQAEMTHVLGIDRLPDFEDRESLPYLECVLKEVYRWNCPVPLGLPHKTMGKDQYSGYDIPAGSMVIPNIWAMTQDVEYYAEPECFRPERFCEMDAETLNACDPRNMVFGFGRRICPGQQFADSSIWLAVANITATLDICEALNASGKAITPSASFMPGFVSHPEDFACKLVPRSEKVLNMVSNLNTSCAI